MRATRIISLILIITSSSCVDRLFYDINLPQGLPIAVYGHISNQPGPYQVNINTSFDINSKENIKSPVSARHVNIIDELGSNEELSEVTPGVYQTNPSGIKGRVGGVYKLRIELRDGKIYESVPDTLLAPGTIDTLYHEFYSEKDLTGQTQYGFDVMINGRSTSKTTRYMWNFEGTFKSLTHPELVNFRRVKCFPIDEELGKCNMLDPCTGLRNISPIGVAPAQYKRIGPCECCICWYKIFNSAPILSDEIFSSGTYNAMNIYDVPLNEWIFMYKIHTVVTQLTLTEQSFSFFKSIKAQKAALGSLSQPITGKIPNTFIQIEGTPASVNGIFYSAGTDSKSKYITPNDVKQGVPIPIVTGEGVGWVNCLELFPNATTVKPDFWID